ncbi:MAG: hypothetical protein GWM90_31450 [Gemmatimonadetes bacterium]|nr:hypothetical protein [Gemmatimonadota bacterium]NIQ59749.1 hypothetical protein [Gemmatimonadota bacterium]NIU79951.1 hypothetical protein [Gammaproteobacteria bacterium]NIX48413.1 hypothetical protein [Gemmatimonadota bacterium]NIY12848.1 hypothetical protein [Gemmatimonadota bacterium]
MNRLAGALRLAVLELLARRGRILALLAFAVVALAVAATAAALGREAGHVEMDTLFALGGYPLISGILLVGWLLGRFPLAATLVLMSGVVAADRVTGHDRLLAVRPAHPALLYGVRAAVLGSLAFALSAILLPLFDLIMIGRWAGPATLVLILAHVLVWGGLTALLSTLTRLDAWIVLLLALTAMVWTALNDAALVPLAGPLADLLAFVLPPQRQLFALESAFADVEPIPWGAFWFCAGYGAVALLVAGWSVGRRRA